MILVDSLRNFDGSKFFDITYDALQWQLFVSPNYQMHVIAHDTIRTNLESFMLLTVPQAIQENIPVPLPSEHIQLCNDGERNKIKLVLMADLVLAAHGELVFVLT